MAWFTRQAGCVMGNPPRADKTGGEYVGRSSAGWITKRTTSLSSSVALPKYAASSPKKYLDVLYNIAGAYQTLLIYFMATG